MSDCRNPASRWPPADIMRKAVMIDDTGGKIPFVDTEAAARCLALSPHSLECSRSLGGGPPFYKLGKFVRYASRTVKPGPAAGGTTGPVGPTLGSTEQ